MDAVTSAIQSGDFTSLADNLEAAELSSPGPSPFPDLQMLAHICNGDLVGRVLALDAHPLSSLTFRPLKVWAHRADARLVWRRLDPDLRQGSQVHLVFQLLQACWVKDYLGAWQLLNGSGWSDAQRQLLAVYIPQRREDMGRLLGQAYCCISPRKAGSLLNLPEGQADTYLQERGWRPDSAEYLQRPPSKPQAGDRTSLQHLSHLMGYIEQLECS